MSRPRRGLQLPQSLQQELGVELNKRRRGNGVQQRRDQRKEKRIEKRGGVRRGRQLPPSRRPVREAEEGEEEEEGDDDELADDFDDEASQEEGEEEQENVKTVSVQPVRPQKENHKRRPSISSDEDSDSIPANDPDSADEELEADEPVYERLYRGSTPEIVLDAGSRSYKDRQAEEDAEVAALEKRLGLKKGKKRKGGDDDGLADLLGEIDEGEDDGLKRKREGDDWLRAKRMKREMENGRQDVGVEDGDETVENGDEDDEDGGTDLSDDDFSGFDSDDTDDVDQRPEDKPRIRENPYVPPVAEAPAGKYIPPSLRKAQSQPTEGLQRLRRQLQGHLNKLSEANLISIVSEIETIYRNNPRGDVTDILIDLILNLFTSPSTLSNTFVILHAAFATAVYRTTGVDFGAQLLSSLIDRFFNYHQNTTTATTTPKEPLNLLSLLANLFIFSLVASPIITSLIARLLDPLTEVNAELLLRLIRDCGPQLRSTDPGALKTIAARTSAAVNALQAAGQTVTIRTKFMLETINDLKNNKLRESTAHTGASREHITRMRKALGSLSSRKLRATEPLRLDLSDILNSDRKGKWWLVGASWKGHDVDPLDNEIPDHDLDEQILEALADPNEVSIPSLARMLHLTTPLQHLILSTIATSPSAPIAHEHLLKLSLKNAQIPEIPRVILRCCAAEPAGWNEFYAQLANRLCVLGDKAGRVRKGWEFAFWGWLRGIGAGGEDDDEDEGMGLDEGEDSVTTNLNAINNTAHLLAALIYAGHISLGVLRTVELHLLKEDSKAQLWVEMLLVRVLVLCTGEEAVVGRVFGRLEATPQVVPRLRVFIKKWIRASALTEGKEERRWVKKGCKVAEGVLELLGRSG